MLTGEAAYVQQLKVPQIMTTAILVILSLKKIAYLVKMALLPKKIELGLS